MNPDPDPGGPKHVDPVDPQHRLHETLCRYGNSRGDKYWFAKPCRPFHEILYAKQAGYPYWPAKVPYVLEGVPVSIINSYSRSIGKSNGSYSVSY